MFFPVFIFYVPPPISFDPPPHELLFPDDSLQLKNPNDIWTIETSN